MAIEKNSVDWAALGLEDYGPTFEKLGINSVNKLIDAAPYLERDYGLTGLCKVLGIPNHLKQKKQEPEPEPTPIRKKNKFERFIDKVLYISIALMVILGLFIVIGGELGIIKGELDLSITAQDNPLINITDISAVLVSKEDYDTLVFPIDESGNTKLKARKGEWELYLQYDDILYHCTSWESKAAFSFGTNKTLDVSDLFYRPLLLKFIAPNGEIISGKNAYISDSNEKWFICSPINDEYYVYYIANNFQDIPLYFKIDGYESVQLHYDWNKYRTMELEVKLK